MYIKVSLFVIEIMIWLIGGIYEFILIMNNKINIYIILIILPVGIHALLSYCSVRIFPFVYSIFGNQERSSSPDEEPYIVLWLWVNIADSFIDPLARWSFYENGFELYIFPIGKVFVPWESINKLKIDKWGDCVLIHSCKEIYSPIIGPNRIIDTIPLEYHINSEI
jgi:hypothetical protein